jgi:hypothetical protein
MTSIICLSALPPEEILPVMGLMQQLGAMPSA